MNRNVSIRKIRTSIEKKLDEKRFEHSLGVAFTAANLAALYGENPKDAEIAGLLHDCAKCITDDKKISICQKHHIPVSDSELRNPYLLHAKVGGFLAMNKYQIIDKNIVNSIIYHTTGRPNMSMLEKIIYVSDFIEPSRKNLANMYEVRKLVYTDIDQALLLILEDTLQYLHATQEEVDPLTQKTFDFYTKQLALKAEEN